MYIRRTYTIKNNNYVWIRRRYYSFSLKRGGIWVNVLNGVNKYIVTKNLNLKLMNVKTRIINILYNLIKLNGRLN